MFDEVCPCKDCVPPERTSTCHSHCGKYIKWVTARKEYTDYIAFERHADTDYTSGKLNKIRRKKIWEHLN